MDMAFIQDAIVSHAAGSPSEEKSALKMKIKFQNLIQYLNLTLFNEWQQLIQ
jgi:hypothetical protein